VPDEDVTSTEETEATGEETGTETTSTEWTPPSKEEWERVTKALTKRNGENQKLREQKQGAEAATESAVEKALREKQERDDARIVRSETKAALAAAKAKADRIPDLLLLANAGALKLDDDGEVEGLDDVVDGLKTKYPEWFDGRTTGKGNIGAGEKKTPEKKLSYAQQLLANAKQ
jgi:hypothetical protein